MTDEPKKEAVRRYCIRSVKGHIATVIHAVGWRIDTLGNLSILLENNQTVAVFANGSWASCMEEPNNG